MFGKKKKYNTYSDKELMQFIQKGKSAAFDELYNRYHRRMYFYFYKMLGQNEARANDFTQELFMKIIEKPETFNGEYHFSTWFYTLANNLCKNEYRKLSNRQKAYEQHTHLHHETISHTEINHDQLAFETQLDQALDQLSEQQRACFILRYKEELSIEEISEIINCPAGTVKSRLFYATRKLNELLQSWNVLLENS